MATTALCTMKSLHRVKNEQAANRCKQLLKYNTVGLLLLLSYKGKIIWTNNTKDPTFKRKTCSETNW